MISKAVKKYDSDRYVKHFKCQDHLFSMLFCVLEKCNSLREVSHGMLAMADKKESLRINHIPKKSTLADANANRNVKFFEEIYHSLLLKYNFVISDSQILDILKKEIKIIDSTTIGLFKEILKCTGRKSISGKSKGGIKAHSVINVDEKAPELVWFSSGATNDQNFLKKLKCDKNIVYVFDKGYNDYKIFKLFSENETGFVTRIKDNAKFEKINENSISENIHSGVISDTVIEVEVKENGVVSKLKLRKVNFYDRENKKEFEFITNLFDFRPATIAALYKLRRQIELVFKQLKQNFPLKYFLGDNENAIKIYCVLIVNLLLEVIRKTLKKKWSFSNLVSFCRIHLFNYIHVLKFLESSEQEWGINKEYYRQLGLFDKNFGTEYFSSV